MQAAIGIVEDEVFHVSAVKAFHQEVRAAETSAAIAAWHAGNHARKLQEQFGWSLRKIAEETGVPVETTHRYVSACRHRHNVTDIRFGETIESVIGEHSNADKKARAATFSNAEAEYTMKLVRMAESTSEHEAVAKLDASVTDLKQSVAPHLWQTNAPGA